MLGRTFVVVIVLWAAAQATPLFSQEPGSLQPKDGLVCLLVNENSGRCLSVAGGAVESGARVVQGPTPDQATAGEHWRLLGAGPAFRLRNEHSGLVLQVWSSNRQPGVQPVQAEDQVTKEHQHWTFEPQGDAFLLRAGHSQLVLGVAQGAHEEGARVIQWTHLPDQRDQLWALRPTTGAAGGEASRRPRGGAALAIVLGVLLTAALAAALAAWGWRRRRQRDGQAPVPLARPADDAGPRPR